MKVINFLLETQMQTIKQLKIIGFKVAAIILLMTPLIVAQEIEEVVVSGSFIPDEKRDTSEISAILDSSEMKELAMII